MLEKDTLIRVQTRTKEDIFGDCLYKIVETGVSMPDPSGQDCLVADGVRCVMLGGSGPSARKGFEVMDREPTIQANIREGITEIITDDKRAEILAYYEDRAKDGTPRRVAHGGSGVLEL
jgi:2-keto-3-deoxy-L-rhamnonate aldolase RhmA